MTYQTIIMHIKILMNKLIIDDGCDRRDKSMRPLSSIVLMLVSVYCHDPVYWSHQILSGWQRRIYQTISVLHLDTGGLAGLIDRFRGNDYSSSIEKAHIKLAADWDLRYVDG